MSRRHGQSGPPSRVSQVARRREEEGPPGLKRKRQGEAEFKDEAVKITRKSELEHVRGRQDREADALPLPPSQKRDVRAVRKYISQLDAPEAQWEPPPPTPPGGRRPRFEAKAFREGEEEARRLSVVCGDEKAEEEANRFRTELEAAVAMLAKLTEAAVALAHDRTPNSPDCAGGQAISEAYRRLAELTKDLTVALPHPSSHSTADEANREEVDKLRRQLAESEQQRIDAETRWSLLAERAASGEQRLQQRCTHLEKSGAENAAARQALERDLAEQKRAADQKQVETLAALAQAQQREGNLLQQRAALEDQVKKSQTERLAELDAKHQLQREVLLLKQEKRMRLVLG